MEVKIRIKTPAGQAKAVEGKLRFFLMGKQKIKELYTSPEDNEIIWVIEDTPRKILEVNKRVSMYGPVIKRIFEDKRILKLVDPGDLPKLKEMLENHTSVEIVHISEQEREIEPGVTWWQRIKDTFKKT